jgi:drug/metabolite transporter (DMT)-like permease
MRGNIALAIVLAVIGVICLVFAIIYFTLKTNLLASGHPIRHTDRGVVLLIVAVVCFVAGYLARPRRVA